MAIGDRIPTELCAPTVLSATPTSKVANASSSYRTQILEIWLTNTAASTRTVTLYKNGVTSAYQIMGQISLAANGGSALIPTHLVCTATQYLAASQDTGNDVYISCYGVVEQIA